MAASRQEVRALAASLPEWLPRYLPGFHDLRRVLALADGFVLLPVEVPGPDVARVLADWLDRRGVPVQRFAPRSDVDWETLAASIQRSPPPSREGVAMVIGSSLATPGVLHGLRLVNQRRDTLSRHLGRPLLWCGPTSFLDLTWDHAPDFWSVRAVEQRVLPVEEETSPLERLRSLLREARAQGDLRNEVRLCVQLADDLTAAGAFEEAAALVEETRSRAKEEPVEVWAELAVRHAQILRAGGDLDGAVGELTRLIESGLPEVVEASARMERGAAHVQAGRFEEAAEDFRRAGAALPLSTDPTSRIRLLIASAPAGPAGGIPVARMQEQLEAAVEEARSLGDAALEAMALRALARVTAAQHDEGKSRALLEEARKKELPEYEDAGTYEVGLRLSEAREKRAAAIAAGRGTAEIDAEILALRRRLREGGRLRAGDSLGDDRFLLLRKIGSGGFASVWEALDRRRDERVAVKVLHSELAGDATRRERFFRGARLMASLMDEAVVRVVEPPREEDGYCYFVMELLSGVDFQRAVVEEKLPPERALGVVLTIAGALGRAHRQGIVHRDVKPSNILLDAAGAPKLTDFDLALAEDTTGGTRSGAMGTFLYAAPEVLARPQAAGPSADVYSLGMTAIFGLRGAVVPFSALGERGRLVEELPCGAAVKQVLLRAVSPEPEGRYPDAGMFGAALRQAMAGGPAMTGGPVVAKSSEEPATIHVELAKLEPTGPRKEVPVDRRWLFLGAGIVAGVVLATMVWAPVIDGLDGPDPSFTDADASADAGGTSGSSASVTATAPSASASASSTPPLDAGPSPGEDAGAAMDWCPRGSIRLAAAAGRCIQERPVTVGEYKVCAERGKCSLVVSGCEVPTAPSSPMACVDWFEATAYCRMKGGWLPSFQEWKEGSRSPRFFDLDQRFSEWTGDLDPVRPGDPTPDGPSAVRTAVLAVHGSEPPERSRVSRRSMVVGFRCVIPFEFPL